MLYNDANGLTDNLINGTATGVVAVRQCSIPVGHVGRIAYKTQCAAGGAYTFPAVDVNSSLSLQLSLEDLAIGDPKPTYPDLPGTWVPTGDSYGLNNLAGIGIRPTPPSCSITVNSALVNITAVNFGIERVPDTDDKSVSYPVNTPGLRYTSAVQWHGSEMGILAQEKHTRSPVFRYCCMYYNSVPVTAKPGDHIVQSCIVDDRPDDGQ